MNKIFIPKYTTTPLWVFLYLCERSNGEYYTSHLEGARALWKYLSPIELPLFTDKLSPPALLRNYEIQEMARLIESSHSIPAHIAEDIITVTIIQEVWPRLL